MIISLNMLLAAGLAITMQVQAATLSPQEERGKQIYFAGTSDSGQAITAYVGAGLIPIPAAAVPCASCHGYDGRGRPEGGVLPSDITWAHLSKAYGHTHPYGRKHPAFDDATLAQSVVGGVDPASNRLDPAMPRYTMSDQDLDDLVRYIKRLGDDLDPGLSDSAIHLATAVPLGGGLRDVGQAMLGLLQAYFAEINEAGGIHGRRIELAVVDYAGERADRLGDLTRLFEQDRVFAMVSPFMVGLEEEVSMLAEEQRVPVVGPFTLFPAGEHSLQRFTFYILSGLREQARALIDYAADGLELSDPRIGVVHPATDPYREIAEAVRAQAQDYGWTHFATYAYPEDGFAPADLAKAMHAHGTQVVVYLGSGAELQALVREAQSLAWTPYLMLPGSLANAGLFTWSAELAERIRLAYPTGPGDHTPSGIRAFRGLQERHGLSGAHQATQISAFSAAVILTEALKRAGRDLSRERLITALEGLHAFEPGLAPAISYGPNRRIGALGAHIVAVDVKEKRFRPVGGWIALD